MENEKKTSVYSRLLACFIALLILAPFVGLFFYKPVTTVKADAGNYVSYYSSAIAEYCAGGFTSAQIASAAFGVALGTQLMLLAIAEQCEIERQQNPGATLNFSSFKSTTGYYQISGDSGYYPMTFPIDKNLNSNITIGQYPALDGGLIVATCPHWSAKLLPTGGLTYASAYPDRNNVTYQMQGLSSATVDFIPKGDNTNFWDPRYSTGTRTDISLYMYLRFSSSIPVYAPPTNPNNYIAWNSRYNGGIMCGIPSGVDTTSDNLPNVEVSPDNLPDIYNTYIVNIYAPEYLIFPDGWPEEPTEPSTEETTESPSGDPQMFTLPPEWLETYPIEPETFPTIPFTDVEPPSIDEDYLQGFSNGMNFWWYICHDIVEALNLEKFIALCFALAVLFFVLWRLGSGGSGGGDDD